MAFNSTRRSGIQPGNRKARSHGPSRYFAIHISLLLRCFAGLFPCYPLKQRSPLILKFSCRILSLLKDHQRLINFRRHSLQLLQAEASALLRFIRRSLIRRSTIGSVHSFFACLPKSTRNCSHNLPHPSASSVAASTGMSIGFLHASQNLRLILRNILRRSPGIVPTSRVALEAAFHTYYPLRRMVLMGDVANSVIIDPYILDLKSRE